LKLNIHTLLIKDHADTKNLKVRAKSEDTRMFDPTMLRNSELLLRKVQYLSQLKLTNPFSNFTKAVSSTQHHVVPNLITVFLLLDMEVKEAKNTSSLRTPGAHHGVTEATSRLEEAPQTPAVFSLNHLTQRHEEVIENDCNT